MHTHVMVHGNRREAIFLDDTDRRFLLATLAEACGRTDWRVHAWAHAAKTAEKLVRGRLAAEGLTDQELDRLPGSDPRKVRVARTVREQTTVSMSWIAARLRMRSAANVSHVLRRARAEPTASTKKRGAAQTIRRC